MEQIVKHSERNSNIEMLRLLLMLFICYWHFVIYGLGFHDLGKTNYDYNTAVTTFWCSLFVPAVNCFVFISGWYGMRFKIKKFTTLAIFGFLCFIVCEIIKYAAGKPVGGVIFHLFPISCYNWWFFTAYMQLFLIAPFIEYGIEKIGTKNFRFIIIALTVINILNLTSQTHNHTLTLYGVLYIYMLARYMRTVDFKMWRPGIVFLMSFMALWGLTYFTSLIPGEGKRISIKLLEFYNNPFTIIMAVSLFYIIKSIKPYCNKTINKWLKPILTIYLIEEGTNGIFYEVEGCLFRENVFVGILSISVIAIVIIVLGHPLLKISSAISGKMPGLNK